MAHHQTRREFTGLLLASALGAPFVLTRRTPPPGARLTFRPRAASGAGADAGPQPLGLGGERDGVLYVPRGYQPDRPVPLLLALHGATGSSRGPIRNFGPVADDLGVALVVPDSRLRTWEAIMSGEFSVDRDFIDRSLALAAARVSVDPRRIGVVGFSDGATYAIALGRANGDVFQAVSAFSPGFIIDVTPVGRPAFFISHGTHDHILPIDQCSRKIVPALKEAGYRVDYREFDGDHEIPPAIALAGLKSAAGAA